MKILLLALVCASLAQSGMTSPSLAQSGMTMNSFNSPIPQDIITFITNFVKQIIIPLVENVKTLLPPAAQKIFANLVEDFRPAITKLEQNVRPTTTENNNRMFNYNVIDGPNGVEYHKPIKQGGFYISGHAIIGDGIENVEGVNNVDISGNTINGKAIDGRTSSRGSGNNRGTKITEGPYTGTYKTNCMKSKDLVKIYGKYKMDDGNRQGKKLLEISNKGDNGVDVRVRNEGTISKYHYNIPTSYTVIDRDDANGIAITIVGIDGSRQQYCWL
uniref:Uncharacterized protein n=1 Tax=Cacopsylla melanoneura TaxID=428564 RepID=A0A8D9EBK4_9HEMI